MGKMYSPQNSVGTKYKASVSTRKDKIAGGGDAASVQNSTSAAFNKAHKDSKKC